MATSPSKSTKAEASAEFDAVTTEIIRNYMLSAVREMISVTTRAAYSTCFSEAVDFSCALFDERGRLFAQAGGIPVHFGSLFDAVDTILEQEGELEEGDVILHNDPYSGACHQADVVVATPMFSKGEFIGLSVNRGHWMDVGGMAAGGWSGSARHVAQEGLIIPVCHLYRKGEVNREVREFVLKNVRMPRLIWGDIQAQIASARAAADRMSDLVDRYGLAEVREAIQHSLDYAKKRFRERMDSLPNGVFKAEDVMDDDGFGGGPFHIRITIDKTPDKILVDFEGTDEQAQGPANCTFALTKAGVLTALKALVDPEMPLNSGILDLIEVSAPPGTIVNPTYPAPVFFGTADPVARVCDTTLKVWAQVIPDRLVAGSYSSGHNSTGWSMAEDGTESLWYIFGPGGCGARKDKDGLTAEWHTVVSCGNESMEIWEARFPIRFLKRELRQDSGGPGRTRGGLGDVRIMEVTSDTFFTACADRWDSQSWSIEDGLPGVSNEFRVQRGGREYTFPELFGVTSPSKFSNLPLIAGDRIVIRAGGGGGFGPPQDRDEQQVASDVKNGYVSAQVAQDVYRVALEPDETVDRKTTDRLRSAS